MKNNKGQALTEYILIVALVAIASMGVVRILGQSMKIQLTNITRSLQGGKADAIKSQIKIDRKLYQKSDMSNFWEAAASDEQK